MTQMARQGVAILMISSELPEVVGMSDRVYVMREGSIAGETPGRRHQPGKHYDAGHRP
ncbi:Arabinose import ATP-binding protein AraG [Raoultella planticola]|uniref:Arabinose import ATP-binding protein AraG n=1 Tax=Raoultella planticola TaxID=575 RepID=A0A485AMD7_RAOPL|nr:Arabinose import ATP-binding protein AraG [Raoultella planticola]